MKDSPEISVIVPVYKGRDTLRTALDSLRRQTFADWECLCIDDGSTDGSGEVADAIAREDMRFRVIHQENGGTSMARNAGLRLARGRYFAFLDEDDAYHPQFLEILHAEALRTGAEITGCGIRHFGDGEVPAFDDGLTADVEWQVADRGEIANWMTKFYYGIPFEVWRNLYRRDLAAGLCFRKGVRVEQDLLWHYALLPKVRLYAKTSWRGYAWRESATGGYLHPDAESLISLLRSYCFVLDEVAAGMAMSEAQRRALASAIASDVKWNVWRHLRAGIFLSADQSASLRKGVRALNRRGAGIDRCLNRVHRWQWNLFVLTGWRGLVCHGGEA